MKYELERKDVSNIQTAISLAVAALAPSTNEDDKRTVRTLNKTLKSINEQEKTSIEAIVKKPK